MQSHFYERSMVVKLHFYERSMVAKLHFYERSIGVKSYFYERSMVVKPHFYERSIGEEVRVEGRKSLGGNEAHSLPPKTKTYCAYPNLLSTSLLISMLGEAKIMPVSEARSRINWKPRAVAMPFTAL